MMHRVVRVRSALQRLATEAHAPAAVSTASSASYRAMRVRSALRPATDASVLPAFWRLPRSTTPACSPLCRCFTTSRDDERDASASSAGAAAVTSGAASPEAFADVPGVESPGEKFVMLYTCAVCETRAAKTISKHAYQKGVVLVRCPGCEKLHLIADRLGWFDDESVDVESILAAKGESVRVVTHEDVLELTDRELLGHLRKDE